MHTNLFSNGHTTTEVYAAMRKHQKRDQTIVAIADLGLMASIWMSTRASGGDRLIWFLLIAFCAMIALRYFIDMSNRNSFLHRLDWDEAKRREDAEEAYRLDRLRRRDLTAD